MPRLTAAQVKQEASRRTDKVRSLPDGLGLVLKVEPAGKAYWVQRIFRGGKETMRGIGPYPKVSLLEARRASTTLRAQAQDGALPAPKNAPAVPAKPATVTFKLAAERWYEQTSMHLSEKHRAQVITTLRTHAYPSLGNKRIDAISPGDIEQIIRDMLRPPNPMLETASRVYQRIGSVFEYAGRQGWCPSNPASLLKGEITRLKKQVKRNAPPGHHAALLDDEGIAAVLKAIAAYPAVQTRAALEAIIYTGCRSGELRKATWDEVDFENARWTIPADHMKAGREHIIPLSEQALARLRILKTFTRGDANLVLQGERRGRPVSDMTLSMALRRMGFKDQQTVHGFRAWLSTKAREAGHFPRDVVEAALAHTVARDATEAAYLRSNFLEQRVELMRWWGQWVDGVRDQGCSGG